MIKLTINFNKMAKNKEDFILELCQIFNIPKVFGWDAFRDNFSDIFDKVPNKDYLYKENDEWCWNNEEHYNKHISYYSKTGPKNKQGEKDDMKLIFINFYPFFIKNQSIANPFFEIILEYINIANTANDEDECLSEAWYKMVVEIHS